MCGLVHPPRDAAGWQCPAQPYRPAGHLAVGRVDLEGGAGETAGTAFGGSDKPSNPKAAEGEESSMMKSRGEVGNEVGDCVVRPQRGHFEETTD